MREFNDFDISKVCWFGTGSIVKKFYIADTITELQNILKTNKNIFILGAGSNTLIQSTDNDSRNLTIIKLGAEFRETSILERNQIKLGCAVLSKEAANFAANNSLSGLEFLFTIPGTIGGNIRMNAGCYGSEIKDALLSIECLDFEGNLHTLIKNDIIFEYRNIILPKKLIFLTAVFQCKPKEKSEITATMTSMNESRIATQPTGVKTCGSTFKNPPGHKAWELIDAVGMRGYAVGGAKFSEKHSNFIVNFNNATPNDITTLGNEAIKRIKAKFNINMEWEIEIM